MDFITNENKEIETKIKDMESRISYFFDVVIENRNTYYIYINLNKFNVDSQYKIQNIRVILESIIYRIEEEKEKENLDKKEESYVIILKNYFKG